MTSPKLIYGDSIPISGEFSGFEGHKDKSSRIDIIPTGGILRKDKGARNIEKAWHELVALHAWKQLLGKHNESTDSDFHLDSPDPIALDDKGRIYMQLVEGVSADASLSGNFSKSDDCLTMNQVRQDLARRLGRLVRIKDIEKLAHYDFQLRHLIQGVNTRSLSIIDVENSKVDDKKRGEEHNFIMGQIDLAVGQSARISSKFDKDFQEGYESSIDNYPVIEDIAHDIRREFGLHENVVSEILGSK